jgi:hypothetical protein
MSSVVARRILATPVRDAGQTWDTIMSLIAPDANSDARKDLVKASGIACSSIASEATRGAAIVVWGGGVRVRFYCLFDEDAMTGDGKNEDALPSSPTQGDWKVSIPCLPEDVAWSQKKLSATCAHVCARSMDEDVNDGEREATRMSAGLTINMAEFLKS